MGNAATLELMKQRRELLDRDAVGDLLPAVTPGLRVAPPAKPAPTVTVPPPPPRPPRRGPPPLGATTLGARLLAVARTLDGPFTVEQLAVAAWQADPETWGMRGFPYPNLHRTVYLLSGRVGLVARGKLTRLGGGMYEVVR